MNKVHTVLLCDKMWAKNYSDTEWKTHNKIGQLCLAFYEYFVWTHFVTTVVNIECSVITKQLLDLDKNWRSSTYLCKSRAILVITQCTANVTNSIRHFTKKRDNRIDQMYIVSALLKKRPDIPHWYSS